MLGFLRIEFLDHIGPYKIAGAVLYHSLLPRHYYHSQLCVGYSAKRDAEPRRPETNSRCRDCPPFFSMLVEPPRDAVNRCEGVEDETYVVITPQNQVK